MKDKAFIFVNRFANNGKSGQRWDLNKEKILNDIHCNVIVFENYCYVKQKEIIQSIFEEKIYRIILIAAGGDGTVNQLLNVIMSFDEERIKKIIFGCIGLGSSNDMHKPYKAMKYTTPAKLDFKNEHLIDIGKVSYLDSNHCHVERFFLINASLGITAEANHFFNGSSKIVNFFKSKILSLAINYTAFRTIFSYQNKKIKLKIDKKTIDIELTNLNILKRKYISGSLHYQQNIELDDGLLGINYCHKMNKTEVVKTLLDLEKGQFQGKPKRYSLIKKQIQVDTDDFLYLETDGEVTLGKKMKFTVLKKSLCIAGES